MIADEHIRDYIGSLEADPTPELMQLEEWALSEGVPIIRRDTQRLLRFLLREEKPMQILEIGTAVGFSTLYMYEYAPKDCSITTIEKVEMRLVHARKNLAGHGRIRLLEGDAGQLLTDLADTEGEKYDFIFLDAAKGQYMSFLADIMRLLKKGGMLITDNVLLEGSIARSKYSIERRDRTIHMRMREYLHAITHMDELDTIILPVGDGMSLSRRVM